MNRPKAAIAAAAAVTAGEEEMIVEAVMTVAVADGTIVVAVDAIITARAALVEDINTPENALHPKTLEAFCLKDRH